MSTVLQYSPGSQVTVLLQIVDELGAREDGYSIPVISRIILPDLSESTLYPIDMIKISVGLYYHKFSLPTGSIAIGTYIVDIDYTDADNNPKQDFVQILCTSSGGQFSVSPS